MKYLTAYNTIIGSTIKSIPLAIAVERALIDDDTRNSNMGIKPINDIKPIGLIGNNNAIINIPFIPYPLLVKTNTSEYLVNDYRPYTVALDSIDNHTGDNYRIRNKIEFDLNYHKQILSLNWLSDQQTKFMESGLRFAGHIYCIIMSEILTQRFNLDFGQQVAIQVITNFYYISLFSDNDTTDYEYIEKCIIKIASQLNIDTGSVDKIISPIKRPINNLNELAVVIVDQINDTKLKGLNAGVIINLLSRIWYGFNASSQISVALEYPPLWIAMVYAAINEKTYKHTKIAQVNDRLKRSRENRETFISNYMELINNSINHTI